MCPRLEVATQTTVREVRTRLPPRVDSRAGAAAARSASEGHAAAVAVPKVGDEGDFGTESVLKLCSAAAAQHIIRHLLRAI